MLKRSRQRLLFIDKRYFMKLKEMKSSVMIRIIVTKKISKILYRGYIMLAAPGLNF